MKKIIFIGVLAAFALGACNDKPTLDPSEAKTITVKVNHIFDNEPLTFLSKGYTLASGEVVNFKRLSYLLGGFYLVKSDGTKIMLDKQYALLKVAENLNSFVLNDIPMGDYKAIGFSIGLDSVTNHGNPNQYASDHPLSPINNSLHWSWVGGYIFTAIEGNVADSIDNFVYHLAGSQNELKYEFDINFTKNETGLSASLDYNLAEVFRNPETFSMAVDGYSCHTTTDPVCYKLIGNMNDVFAFRNIE